MTRGPAAVLHDLRRAVSEHRVLLAAGLAAGSVATGLPALAPAAAPTTAVVVAARDLSAGVPLTSRDVRTVDVPVDAVPSGAVVDPAAVVGRLVPGPVRTGETLTDVRLLGGSLLPPGGEVAAPVRVGERAAAALVRAGDVVDVLAAAPDGGTPAATVVAAVRVLSVPVVEDDPGEGALLVLAVSRAAAARLATAAVTGRLSVVLHGR